MKKFRVIVCFSVFVLSGYWFVSAQRIETPPLPNQEPKPLAAPPAKQIPKAKRIREGTAFKDKQVFFQQIGERTALFTVEDNQRFTCLENLTLERILAANRENPEHKFWKIEGEFTEFRGENYVLVRRAAVSREQPNSAAAVP